MNHDSTVAIIPQKEFLEGLNRDPDFQWTYPENQDVTSEGTYILGEGTMRSETLAEYLSAFADVGFSCHVDIFGPEELGQSITVVLEESVSRKTYEERVEGLDFVPNYEELALAAASDAVEEILFHNISPEIQDIARDYLTY